MIMIFLQKLDGKISHWKRYKFTNEHDLLGVNDFSFVQKVFEYEFKL